ncbi:MAG: hypothetical protein IJ228_10325 [Succinivibrio sp.]|nr:hypothetical protein [Succinivibrio sp.]
MAKSKIEQRGNVQSLGLLLYGQVEIKERVNQDDELIRELTLKGYERHSKKEADGSFTNLESTFYTVVCGDEEIISCAPLLCRGLKVRVSGKLSDHSFRGRDGKERVVHRIDATDIAVDLGQSALRQIVLKSAA